MAERLGKGLQNLVQRFESARDLQKKPCFGFAKIGFLFVLNFFTLDMIIGEDYEKIKFTFMNLELLEPNAFVTDTLIAVVSLSIAFVISRQNKTFSTPFFNYWKWLFIVYGVGFFFGGLGHVFYGYFGATGKYYPMVLGLGIPLLIEHAMISLLPQEIQKKWFLLSKLKLGLAWLALTIIILTLDGSAVITALLAVPVINLVVGLVLSCAVLGVRYSKNIHRSFRIFPITVYILAPAGAIQFIKVSPAQWFDRNDLGHMVVIVSLIMYYYAINGYRKHLLNKTT